MNQLFLQMSGAPGAGKSTIATAVAQRINAVIIDHDVTKSALVESGVSATSAGRASYAVLIALARHLLQQGHTVIVDSPCYYQELLENGQRAAREANVPYLYVECRLDDLTELDRRLRNRERHPTQVSGVSTSPPAASGRPRAGEEMFRDWIQNMKRPESDYIVLDTSQPIEICVQQAMKYIWTHS